MRRNTASLNGGKKSLPSALVAMVGKENSAGALNAKVELLTSVQVKTSSKAAAQGGEASPTKPPKAPSPKSFDRQKLSDLLKTSALCLVQVESEKNAALARIAELELQLAAATASTTAAAATDCLADSTMSPEPTPAATPTPTRRKKSSTPKSSTPKPSKHAASFTGQEDFHRCIVELIEARLQNDNLRMEIERLVCGGNVRKSSRKNSK